MFSKKNNNHRFKMFIFAIKTFIVLFCVGIFFMWQYYVNNGQTNFHYYKYCSSNAIKVACVGDSITYGKNVEGWYFNNYPEQLSKKLGKNYNVRNFGVSGSTAINNFAAYSSTKMYKESIEYEPDILIIMFGLNDSKAKYWNEKDFIEDYDYLIKSYMQTNPDIKIYICSTSCPFADYFSKYEQIQPDVVEIVNNIIKEYTLNNNFEYIDVYSFTSKHPEWYKEDGIHPNKFGANNISELIYEYIEQ
ncbi:MAG: GDSL-type esterase/lipase family protein [Eubacterium sp.]